MRTLLALLALTFLLPASALAYDGPVEPPKGEGQ